ncbi:MAG: acyl-CoA oxidase [Saprospiraceae bacterium]|jgi:acyl-CoA oxidase
MSTQPPDFPKYSPGVLSLLPLYYVGWADSILSPGEVKLIREKVKQLNFLTVADKRQLVEWTDPGNPPSQALFRHWVSILKKQAASLPKDSKKSLVELGLEMARKSTTDQDVLKWQTPETKDALKDIEKALGILGSSSIRTIFKKKAEETAGFDIKTLRALLDDDYSATRNQLRTLLSDPAFKLENIRDKEAYREKILTWCKLLADRGFGALAYPEAYGGKGSMGDYIATFEMLGYHDSSLTIKFGVQFGLFGGSVFWLGTKKHHDKYLKDIGTLKLPGCFAMTETGHGSNVRGLETTATYDPLHKEFIIHTPNEEANKEYIGNALHGKMGTVFAQLIVNGENHGVHALLVLLRDDKGKLMPGVRIEDCGYKLGLNGVDNGKIWFDQVRIPKENLLNKFGDVDEAGVYSSPIKNPSRRFFTMLGTLVGGRVSVPRAGLSAAKTGLAIAIKYGLKRRQFAPKEGEAETILLDYPSHQRRLMPLLAKAYALDFGLTHLANRYINRTAEDIREIETLAAGLKSYSTWFTTKALQDCREACGGKGYLAENRFADLMADTEIFTTFEGDNTVLMQLVAKGLLSDFKKSFHDEGFTAVLRFLSTRVSTKLTSYNPFFTRNTAVEHLKDSTFQLEAFKYRETKLLISVSQRIRKYLHRKIPANEAFGRCQSHLLLLSQAFVEHLVLEQFVKTVNAVEDLNLHLVLKRLCDLYALSTMEEHKGWYLESEYMQPPKTKAIRRVVNKLCKEVRKDAGLLVDAFDIPKQCLAAPIAF